MIQIHTLTSLPEAELPQIIRGYTSTERYRVEKQDSDTEICLRLKLESLDQPYVKEFPVTPADLDLYREFPARGYCLGAYDGDQLVGIALADPSEWNGTLWIWEFHILPAWQGHGIGHAMMDLLAKRAAIAGLRALLVETQNTNLPAIRFYRSVGFSIHGIDVSYYTNQDIDGGEVAIFMKRPLERH